MIYKSVMDTQKLIQRLSAEMNVSTAAFAVWRSRGAVPLASRLRIYKAALELGVELTDDDFVLTKGGAK